MTNRTEDLGKKVEQLIAEHIAAMRKAAQEAMERAFASSRAVPTPADQRVRARQGGKRRAAADLAALGERFYGAVCTKPGETMTVLAAEVGASAVELQRAAPTEETRDRRKPWHPKPGFSLL